MAQWSARSAFALAGQGLVQPTRRSKRPTVTFAQGCQGATGDASRQYQLPERLRPLTQAALAQQPPASQTESSVLGLLLLHLLLIAHILLLRANGNGSLGSFRHSTGGRAQPRAACSGWAGGDSRQQAEHRLLVQAPHLGRPRALVGRQLLGIPRLHNTQGCRGRQGRLSRQQPRQRLRPLTTRS